MNESITSLDVSGRKGTLKNRITAKGVKWIVPVLKCNKVLSILDLSGNSIKSEGLVYIAEGIVGNVTLMSLKIAYNEIQGCTETLKCLKAILLQSKVIELDLSENPIGNKCMEGFFAFLPNEKTQLKRLLCASTDLDCNFSLTHSNLRTSLVPQRESKHFAGVPQARQEQFRRARICRPRQSSRSPRVAFEVGWAERVLVGGM